MSRPDIPWPGGQGFFVFNYVFSWLAWLSYGSKNTVGPVILPNKITPHYPPTLPLRERVKPSRTQGPPESGVLVQLSGQPALVSEAESRHPQNRKPLSPGPSQGGVLIQLPGQNSLPEEPSERPGQYHRPTGHHRRPRHQCLSPRGRGHHQQLLNCAAARRHVR